jgi:hypothetical protein
MVGIPEAPSVAGLEMSPAGRMQHFRGRIDELFRDLEEADRRFNAYMLEHPMAQSDSHDSEEDRQAWGLMMQKTSVEFCIRIAKAALREAEEAFMQELD